MIDRFGDDEAKDLIEYAIAEAPKTNFDMHSLRAVETFVPKWQAARDFREEARRKAEVVAKKQAEDRLRTEYDEVIRAEYFKHLEGMPADARASLRQEALAAMPPESQNPASMGHGLLLQVTERRLLRDRLNLPSFEAWMESRA